MIMTRNQFAIKQVGDKANIDGKLYTLDGKVFDSQKKKSRIARSVAAVVLLGLMVVIYFTHVDVRLFMIPVVLFALLLWVSDVAFLPKDIDKYLTVSESDEEVQETD